jgi:hypothetical protein
MKAYQRLFALIFLLPFLLNACVKGQVGPTGPAGSSGPSGPAGPSGQAGANGNANVQSITFDSVVINPNTIYNFNISAITQAIVDSGTVTVFYQLIGTGDIWYSLPEYYYFNGDLDWLILNSIQLGQASISNRGITASQMNYRFNIIAAN